MSNPQIQPEQHPSAPPTAENLFSARYRYYVLALIAGVNLFNYMDRQLIAVLIDPIKADLGATDAQMGLLTGIAFAFFYATFGFPMARWADRGSRVRVLTVALAAWSVMTVVSGFATRFSHLLLARMGMGVGEAGGGPASQALIADYFPVEQRSTALAIYVLGASVGILIGGFFGGLIADTLSWRAAFWIIGAPGLLFAILIRLTLKEPPRRGLAGGKTDPLEGASLWRRIRHLFRTRAFLHLMLANGILTFSNIGAAYWTAMYFVRSFDLTLTQAGGLTGVIGGIAGTASIIGGGVLTDRLAPRSRIWLIRVPMLAAILALPFHFGYYLAPTWQFAFLFGFGAQIFAHTFPGGLLSSVHALVGPHERALAAAMIMFCASVIGLGLAPLAVGIVSDSLEPSLGSESLRWALVCMQFAPIWGALHLWLASRSFLEELPAD